MISTLIINSIVTVMKIKYIHFCLPCFSFLCIFSWLFRIHSKKARALEEDKKEAHSIFSQKGFAHLQRLWRSWGRPEERANNGNWGAHCLAGLESPPSYREVIMLWKVPPPRPLFTLRRASTTQKTVLQSLLLRTQLKLSFTPLYFSFRQHIHYAFPGFTVCVSAGLILTEYVIICFLNARIILLTFIQCLHIFWVITSKTTCLSSCIFTEASGASAPPCAAMPSVNLA